MKTRQFFILLFLSMSLPAFAHSAGSDHAHGFSAGFAHPFSGWDHWLSFALMGVLAWRVGCTQVTSSSSSAKKLMIFSVTLIFTLAMLAGFSAATRFIGLPYAQFSIAGLLIVMGFVLSLMTKPSLWLGAAIALALGYVHGYVHGIELAGDWQAAVGMLCASASLAALGIAFGLALQRLTVLGQRMQQALGLVGAALGVYLFAA